MRAEIIMSNTERPMTRGAMTLADAHRARPRIDRAFDAAKLDRNVEGWFGDFGISTWDIRHQLRIIRNRSHEMCKNDPYLVQYLASIRNDVVGHAGFQFRPDVCDYRKDSKTQEWTKYPDQMANGILRMHFNKWAEHPELVTANGQKDLVMCQWQVVKDWAREGESVWEILPGHNFAEDNPYGFSLVNRRPDSLALEYSAERSGGVTVYNGVEVNQWGRPIAYHFWTTMLPTGIWSGEIVRIPAERILHVYDEDYANITRGFPLVTCVLRSLKMLYGYDDAEIIKARDQAARVGHYIMKDGSVADPDEIADPQDEDQRDQFQQVREPGEDGIVPYGWDYKEASATAPNSNYPSFQKAVLQRIASGLESEYTMIANNLEGVNMSSIRHGKMDSRESRKCQQRMVIQHFLRPMYNRPRVGWLACFLLSGQSPLPYSKFARFAADDWRGRRWPYMDPLTEAQANEILVRHGHTTDSAIAAEMGEDFEENVATVRQEMKQTKDTPVDNRFLPNTSFSNVEPDKKVEGKDNAGVKATEDVSDADTASSAEAGITTTLTLNGAQITAAVQVIEKLASEIITEASAKALLIAVGLKAEDAETMVKSEVAADRPAVDPKIQEGETKKE